MNNSEYLLPTLEVYSIDKAFLYLADYPAAMQNLEAYAKKIKHIVEQYTGIALGISIGETKTLAKFVNYAIFT